MHPVTAEYPREAREAGLEASVVLRLTIDALGIVTAAEVVEPAGHGFDEAARSAALATRFNPALRGQTPVASRTLLRVEFRLPPQSKPAPAPTPKPRAPLTQSPLGMNDPSAPGATPASAAPVEVLVQGESAGERRLRSAEAVKVIETEHARRRTSDMGEVLARMQGIGVRRAGGLGSEVRFSLNGLTDDQVRFFLNGVPLELAGFPFGVANVPINLIDRVEVYSGVVPIRFGTDALGGVVNFVTKEDLSGTHGSASYEAGAYQTHRVTLSGQHLHEPSGTFARVNGFLDYSDNDYPIDVEAPDERGRPQPARVHRFHDAYRAGGVSAELGLVDRPYAKRLILRGFFTDYEKEYQHNVVMTVPYGGVTYGETTKGVSIRYEKHFGRGIKVDAFAGYTHTRGEFLDVSTCIYDWFGRCVGQRHDPGETDTQPHDRLSWDRVGFGNLNFTWRIHPQHELRLGVAPRYMTRTGDERRQRDPAARDPLTAERKLLTWINGLEYEVDLFHDRLESILFVKRYLLALQSEDPRPGGVFRRRDRNADRFGFGEALRYRFFDWLYAKLSYEYATNLPEPDEVFGDNAFIQQNLELEPERSNNLNLGATIDAPQTDLGGFRAVVNAFSRSTARQIVLLGTDLDQRYQNVYSATSLGVEAAGGWTSPGEYLVIDGNATYQSFRNTSTEGAFRKSKGDRLPNRPYFFANCSVRLQFGTLFAPKDELALLYDARYVHGYFRGWESLGAMEHKQTIPAQLTHTAGLGYFVEGERMSFSSTFEVQNVSDAKVYDVFGVQRPGRAFYGKATTQF
jgi:TonB family protein